MSVLPRRLKEARLRVGISQEKLGILAGLDEMSASTRMNRYEQGKRIPHPTLVAQLGKILGVPAAYFYAEDDDEAFLLQHFYKLSASDRRKILRQLKQSIKE